VPTSVAPQHVFSVVFVWLLFADVEGTTENDFMLSSIGLQFITIQLPLYEFEYLLCWSLNLLSRALGGGSSRFERCSHYATTMPDQLRSIFFRERFGGTIPWNEPFGNSIELDTIVIFDLFNLSLSNHMSVRRFSQLVCIIELFW